MRSEETRGEEDGMGSRRSALGVGVGLSGAAPGSTEGLLAGVVTAGQVGFLWVGAGVGAGSRLRLFAELGYRLG